MKVKDYILKIIIVLLVGSIVFFITDIFIGDNNLNIVNDKMIVNIFSILFSLFAVIIVMLVMKITYVKRSDEKITYEIDYIDKITNMPNKTKFIIDAAELLMKKNGKYAAVVLELNNFENIKEEIGFEEENKILKFTADVIKNNIVENEIFGRASAGRFNIIVRYDDNDTLEKRFESVMNRISNYTNDENNKLKHSINSCCGIYIINDDDIYDTVNEMEFNISHIIGKAKFALGEVLGKYINCCSFYDKGVKNYFICKSDIKNAFINNDFLVYIQPKYDIKNHTLVEGTVIIKWNHHSKGLLSPDKFVPIFEKNGFIADFNTYIFEIVCKTQKKWLDMGLNPVRISVNESKTQFFKNDYIKTLKNIIDKYQLPDELIRIEDNKCESNQNYFYAMPIPIEEYEKNELLKRR